MRWTLWPARSGPEQLRDIPLSHQSLAWLTPVTAEAAALGRSILFAWTLGPEELGQAMMLAVTLRLVEMASDVGIDRLILQASDGNRADLQANLHGVCLIRGLISATILLSLAPVMAFVFAAGPSTSTYALLAVVPLFRGWGHLDYRRFERRFSYVKMFVVEGGATLAMAACLLPAVWIFPDHRAMCVVLIAHAMAHMTLSHVIATRRYTVKLSLATLHRCWVFGAPLILNAGLLFLTFYADRLIVAHAFSWNAVALYGVALQLALLPAQIVGRAAASLVLPTLRRARVQNRLSVVWPPILTTYALLAGFLTVALALMSPAGIALIYGATFRPEPTLALALAIAAGFRILRTPFSQFALAVGRSGDPARANIICALALIPAAVCASAGFPLAFIAAAAALGEAGATLRAFQLSRTPSRHANPKEIYA